MAKFYTKEDYEKYARQQIINNKDVINAIDIIIEAIKTFDGKKLDARFATKANEDLKAAGFKKTFLSLTTYSTTLYCRDSDSYQISEFTCNCVDHIHGLGSIKTDENNRVLSAETVEGWGISKSYIKEAIHNLTHDLENIKKIEAEYNQIKASIENFKKATTKSYLTRELFDFN